MAKGTGIGILQIALLPSSQFILLPLRNRQIRIASGNAVPQILHDLQTLRHGQHFKFL